MIVTETSAKPPTEKEHIRTVGEKLYWRAFGLAQMECRADARLVGLTKVRDAISHEAALRATGFPPRPFKLPRACGEMTVEMLAIIEALLPIAIARATEAYT